jgi:hypothetical protein
VEKAKGRRIIIRRTNLPVRAADPEEICFGASGQTNQEKRTCVLKSLK